MSAQTIIFQQKNLHFQQKNLHLYINNLRCAFGILRVFVRVMDHAELPICLFDIRLSCTSLKLQHAVGRGLPLEVELLFQQLECLIKAILHNLLT